MKSSTAIGIVVFISSAPLILVLYGTFQHVAGEEKMFGRAVSTAQHVLSGEPVKATELVEMRSLILREDTYSADLRNRLKQAGMSDDDIRRIASTEFESVVFPGK